MGTQPMVQGGIVNEFAKNKGEIRKCPMCSNATLIAPMRLFCKWCQGSGYVADCLRCKASGREVSVAPWDGKSEHGSTCNVCGGLKFIPSRVSEFERWLGANDPERLVLFQSMKDNPPELVEFFGKKPTPKKEAPEPAVDMEVGVPAPPVTSNPVAVAAPPSPFDIKS